MISAAVEAHAGTRERIRRTVALLERRGYAYPPERLAEILIGGPVPAPVVLAAAVSDPALEVAGRLVIRRSTALRLDAVQERRRGHGRDAAAYLPVALGFIAALIACAPFIRSVAIAGSLASGGFRAADDVDLNLIVEDGHRYQAYVVLNVLGALHALRHRGKPVDAHTRRPLAPRLMTANLVIEESQCFPLQRQDEDMAYEMLACQPVHGAAFFGHVVDSNPGLAEHFPQLAARTAPLAAELSSPVPGWVYPRLLEGPARAVGRAAWRYMQWTRRRDPAALARVAFVRSTMHPYALFEEC